jgi:hypothetical protein
MSERPPLSPFDAQSAATKVQAAEDAWNTCDPERVSQAYSEDSAWRKRLWTFAENRIAERFQYACHEGDDQWWRSYGNELWEFDEHGLMRRREASINDLAITESERRISGPRPEAERGVEIPLQ